MHVAKLILLLLLTLAVMRVTSWSLGWLLQRLTRARRFSIALLSNVSALIAFAGVLVTQRVPGELMDWTALTFGIVVFTTYALMDLRWTPWPKQPFSDDASS